MTATKTLGALDRLRLWFLYQGYGALLLGSAALLVAGSLWVLPWWTWPVTGLGALRLAMFGVYVVSRVGRKLRATAVGVVRIRQGRFRPESVVAYCGDPCFRQVARELLRRAGYRRPERNALIAAYRRRADELASATFVFDRKSNRIETRIGGDVMSTSIASPTTRG